MRLNRLLSDRGVVSRRGADALIESGKVLVNGKAAVLGQRVAPGDRVTVDGKPVPEHAPEKVILAVHKPEGVVCTAKSFRGEKNIVEMVGYPERLYPVGRLDKDSEGLIFLTNDGDFAKELTRASGLHEKEYEVTVGKAVTDAFLARMEKGIFLKDLEKKTAACRIVKTGEKTFRITLVQGLNRQIRRMCETCGYEVRRLVRVRIMTVTLEGLEKGRFRAVEGDEKARLLKALQDAPGTRRAGGRNGE
ncbi:MAG: pseudouridine synthase [Lachnospiraceae bacterium]|nr:pseudouridine synthase [Lachnospiraceae bacterium]